jgi:hypothetical protein
VNFTLVLSAKRERKGPVAKQRGGEGNEDEELTCFAVASQDGPLSSPVSREKTPSDRLLHVNRNAARRKRLTMEFLKTTVGVELDVRDERRICVELQFAEMK